MIGLKDFGIFVLKYVSYHFYLKCNLKFLYTIHIERKNIYSMSNQRSKPLESSTNQKRIVVCRIMEKGATGGLVPLPTMRNKNRARTNNNIR